MAQDVLDLLEDYIPTENRSKWVKLSSEIESRRLELLLLREILIELRKMNQLRQGGSGESGNVK
jgi:hypothetical protein